MYKPPISLQQQFINDIEKETENAIMCRVRQVLKIDIDEKELLAALRYDRQQYDNGYWDGLRSAVRHGHWIRSCKDTGYSAFDGVAHLDCSVCGDIALTEAETLYDCVPSHYCPNCGARMDEPMEVRDDAE